MMVKKERKDEAVSPVIGVILMVAITVILAAVIGNFVFGFASKMGTAAPNAQLIIKDHPATLETETGGDNVFILEHAGGDTLPCGELSIYIYNKSTGDLEGRLEWNADDNIFEDVTDTSMLESEEIDGSVINPGDTVVFKEDEGTDFFSGTYTVKVFHKPSQTFIFTQDVTVV